MKRRHVALDNTFAVERVQLEKPIHKVERRTGLIEEDELAYKEDYEIRKKMFEERKRNRELGYIESLKKKESESKPAGQTQSYTSKGTVVEGVYSKNRSERIALAKGEELRGVTITQRRRELEDKLIDFDRRVAKRKQKLKEERQTRKDYILKDDDQVDAETLLHWQLRDAGKKSS